MLATFAASALVSRFWHDTSVIHTLSRLDGVLFMQLEGTPGRGYAWGRGTARRPDAAQEKRIKQLERDLGRSHLQIEILANMADE
jgi:hypothetical protein